MKAARQLKDKVNRGEITTGALATDHLCRSSSNICRLPVSTT